MHIFDYNRHCKIIFPSATMSPRKGIKYRYRCREPFIDTLKNPIKTQSQNPKYVCKGAVGQKIEKNTIN